MYTDAMKPRRLRDVMHVIARGGCLLGAASLMPIAGAAMPPLGPTTTSRAVNQINSGSMRPLPSATPRPVVRDSMIWVPTRIVPLPGEPTGVAVPGHWERRLPGTNEVHVPPLTVERPSTGTTETYPAGIRPPVEERYNSP
jgi:hypothetical protein